MASAKTAPGIGVRIDDAGSILKFRIGVPFGENSACFKFLPVRVSPGVDTEFPYRVRIVDRGLDCRDPVCRHRFRFLDTKRLEHTNTRHPFSGIAVSYFKTTWFQSISSICS